MSDRPYVLRAITDQGTVRLLLGDQHELDLIPRDAAELGVQLLRAYGATYPVRFHLMDQPSYGLGTVYMPHSRVLDGSVQLAVAGQPLIDEVRARTLSEVRQVLGIVEAVDTDR